MGREQVGVGHRRIQALIDGDEHAHAELEAGPFHLAHRTYTGAFTQGKHEHADASIDLVLEGGGVGTYGSREVCSFPGRVEFFRHGVRHDFRASASGIRSMHLSIPGSIVDEYGNLRDVCVEELEHSDAMRLALALYREMTSARDASSQLSIESTAHELLGEVARISSSPRGRAGFVGPVRDALHSVLDRPLGLTELAAELGINRGHLARTFKSRIGVSVGGYHRRVRLQAAASRVLGSSEPIARIATETGFADQAHLTRAMRDALGITPAALRRTTRVREGSSASA